MSCMKFLMPTCQIIVPPLPRSHADPLLLTCLAARAPGASSPLNPSQARLLAISPSPSASRKCIPSLQPPCKRPRSRVEWYRNPLHIMMCNTLYNGQWHLTRPIQILISISSSCKTTYGMTSDFQQAQIFVCDFCISAMNRRCTSSTMMYDSVQNDDWY